MAIFCMIEIRRINLVSCKFIGILSVQIKKYNNLFWLKVAFLDFLQFLFRIDFFLNFGDPYGLFQNIRVKLTSKRVMLTHHLT